MSHTLVAGGQRPNTSFTPLMSLAGAMIHLPHPRCGWPPPQRIHRTPDV